MDESIAWALLRTMPRDGTGAGGVRLRADGGDEWLDVDASGAWTASGPVSDSARDVLDIHLPLCAAEHVVVGQLGQSLDGRIATEDGSSHYVTGPRDIERLHRLRALVDAVVVGAGTVAADDPRLTVRAVEGSNPVRVVIDPNGRLLSTRRVFTDGEAPTVVVRRSGEGEAATAGETRPGIDEISVPATPAGDLDLEALVAALRARGLRRILVEGGGITVSSFLRAGLLDRLHVTVAPLLIGSGRPSITLDPIDSLDRALRPACRCFHLGDDVLFDLDLRRERDG